MANTKPAGVQQLLPIAMFVLTQLMTAAGVYSAIRADLREVQVRVAILEHQADRREDRR